MAHAYTPGLQIKPRIRYRVRRVLPIPGEVLVQAGDAVRSRQVIARTEQPGDLVPINLSNVLAIAPADVPAALEVQVGEPVTQGKRLARSQGMFGLFRHSCFAPADGVLESASNVTGQLILRGAPVPVEVNAFVQGVVAEIVPDEGAVIETNAAFMQGIFGIGGEAQGPLKVVTASPDEDLTPDCLTEDLQGAVVVGGRRIHGETVARARELGVAAILAGGIDDADLKEILGYDLGVAITGTERLGLTVIITEGFGEIAMATRTFELLQSLAGREASVNGATQIRAGVQRPEIVVPLDEADQIEETAQRVGGGVLEIGSHVRLIRDPYFGELGTVAALPTEPQVLESGSKARVLEVDCQSGRRVTVPRANVEIVES
jgi:hypothetical protein